MHLSNIKLVFISMHASHKNSLNILIEATLLYVNLKQKIFMKGKFLNGIS